jgi:hypothetical protein
MIDSSQSTIQHVSAHIVGNGSKSEELELSPSPLELHDERIHRLLTEYFLSNFRSPEYHTFTSDQNTVLEFIQQIFDAPETFHEQSIGIARHLFNVSQHPNIKAGDLYVAKISDVFIDNQLVQAVGIFKCENKETFLKLKSFDLFADEGINIRKLDKGCLVMDMGHEDGYKILVVDNANRSDAQFWRDLFLNVKPLSDSFHHTHNFMNLTKEYLSNKIDEEFSVSKADQIDLLNRSVDFFKSHEQFNKAEFETQVLGDVDVIESFRNFGKNFQTHNEVEVADDFEISAHAVQRQAKAFKTVLKLDKNFHIYIHGNRQLIEKGYDESTGKHFYKLYFDEES